AGWEAPGPGGRERAEGPHRAREARVTNQARRRDPAALTLGLHHTSLYAAFQKRRRTDEPRADPVHHQARRGPAEPDREDPRPRGRAWVSYRRGAPRPARPRDLPGFLRRAPGEALLRRPDPVHDLRAGPAHVSGARGRGGAAARGGGGDGSGP